MWEREHGINRLGQGNGTERSEGVEWISHKGCSGLRVDNHTLLVDVSRSRSCTVILL